MTEHDATPAAEPAGLPYLGIATFLGWPLDVDPVPGSIVAIGAPYDEGTPYRAGARFGPRALRDASMRLRFASPDGLRFFEVESRTERALRAAQDAGDSPIFPVDQDRTFAALSERVRRIAEAGAVPLVLGGDNSITYPAVRGLGRPDVVIIQFDAHLDYADEYFTALHANATPMRRLQQEGLIAQVYHVGIRGFDNARSVLEDTEAAGNVVLTAQDCRTGAAARALGEIPAGTPVYLSIDIDVADPSIAPGTGYHEPGGIDHALFRDLIQVLGERCDLVGAEIVEVSPTGDPAGITALLGVHWVIDAMTTLPSAASPTVPGDVVDGLHPAPRT